MQPPAPLVSSLDLRPTGDLPDSSDHPAEFETALSRRKPSGGTQRIALLVRDGVHRAQVEGLIKLLELRGHDTRVLADRLGSVVCSDGSRLPVDASLRRWPAWYFDSVVRLSSAEAAGHRLTAAEATFLQPGSDGSPVPLTRLPWPVPKRPTH